MPRLYIPDIFIKEGQISITAEKARYLISVLRCKKGDELIIFDGRGNCFSSEIIKVNRKEVIVEVVEKFQCNAESPVNIILTQGILKGQKMDMVIQKTTELGVKEIIPLITERSHPRETRKVARWRRIAEEATRQSGRTIVPIIHEPLRLNQFFEKIDRLNENLKTGTQGNKEITGLIFWEEGGLSLKEVVHKFFSSPIHPFTHSPAFILIGPEGGFTKGEASLAERKGFIITSLGKRILRAETAAISAIALVQFLLGDLG
ncbi:MAG: 16S rRNA (uracil(1498)-N(3))-methyltransferase [Thermodesulfovibrionales bacterium]